MFAVWDNYSIRQSFKHNTQCSIIHEQCLMAVPMILLRTAPYSLRNADDVSGGAIIVALRRLKKQRVNILL